MTTLSFRTMTTSAAADAYAETLARLDQRDLHIEIAASSLAKRWQNKPDKIFEVVAEADDSAANRIGMALAAILTSAPGAKPIGPAILAATIDELLMQAAVKQVRKEMGFAA